MNTRELARAIRAKCLECSGGMRGEVRGCPIRSCALWPYRCAGTGNVADDHGGKRRREAVELCEITGQLDIFEVYREA